MTEQSAPSAQPPSPAQGIVGALVSSALLAAWIGWQMGWVWALAGVVGVLVHETGHVLAINALGCGPGRLQIVPFLGGVAYPARAPQTEFKGVLIALAGPVFGLLALVPFLSAYSATGQDRWLGGAFFIAIISLINLAPAPPLDGAKAFGPVLARIHPLVERGALLLVGAVAVLWAVSRGSWIFALFIALGLLGSLRRGRLRPAARALNAPEWAGAAGLYAVAVAVCVVAVRLCLAPSSFAPLARLVGR